MERWNLSKGLKERKVWAKQLSRGKVLQTDKKQSKVSHMWMCFTHPRSSREASVAGADYLRPERQRERVAVKTLALVWALKRVVTLSDLHSKRSLWPCVEKRLYGDMLEGYCGNPGTGWWNPASMGQWKRQEGTGSVVSWWVRYGLWEKKKRIKDKSSLPFSSAMCV